MAGRDDSRPPASNRSTGLPPTAGTNDSVPPSRAPTRLPADSVSPPAGDLSVGEWIGPYRLVRKLGEGGMGAVYEAAQEQPIRRTVALKLIKWGMDTKQFLARFESERQALAVMSHPGIARVFDAGATETGRPYFAMEYAPGVPFTTYCDEKRLTALERLQLFLDVCDGVQHAHQKGIIHRDLKPSNVLVTDEDGRPVPKIIDFGLAKATEQPVTGQSVQTQLGQVMGTPEYMSPEQVDPQEQDIDTRTDVYSLGVILYETLTGELPIPSGELREGGLAELQRKIREQEPAKPSARVSSLTAEVATEVSTARDTDPRSLGRQLHGDLDWIVMKALEKDRTRRYGSPAELAADIRRHLGHEPVLAGPPSAIYRTGKFVRRHQMGVAAGTLVLAALVAGIIGTSVGLARATEARAEAEAQEAIARDEAQTAETVSDFLVDLFEVVDPGEARGNTITAREILDKGADKIEQQLSDQPLMQARMMTTMGTVYRNLGLTEPSQDLLERALAAREESLGPDDPLVADTLEELARVFIDKFDFDPAIEAAQRTIDIRREKLPTAHPDLARILTFRAGLHLQYGQRPDALRLLTEARSIQERLDPEPPDLASTYATLGILHAHLGMYEEALDMLENALRAGEQSLGEDHLEVADFRERIGETLLYMGRPGEARPEFARALQTRERVLEPEHAYLFFPLMGLGEADLLLGEPESALAHFERAVRIREMQFGPRAGQVIWPADGMARSLLRLGRREEAETHLHRTREIMTDLLRADRNPERQAAVRHGFLAHYHALQGDAEQALAHIAPAVEAGICGAKVEKDRSGGGVWPASDPVFAALRGDPRFEVLARSCEMNAIYTQASWRAETGQPEESLRLLRRSLEISVAIEDETPEELAGFLRETPDLELLREDAGFQELLAEIESGAFHAAARGAADGG